MKDKKGEPVLKIENLRRDYKKQSEGNKKKSRSQPLSLIKN